MKAQRADGDEVWCTRRDAASTFRLRHRPASRLVAFPHLQSCVTLSSSLSTGVMLLFLGMRWESVNPSRFAEADPLSGPVCQS